MIQINWKKRKVLCKKEIQLPQNWDTNMAAFLLSNYCYGTQKWQKQRHVKMLY